MENLSGVVDYVCCLLHTEKYRGCLPCLVEFIAIFSIIVLDITFFKYISGYPSNFTRIVKQIGYLRLLRFNIMRESHDS